MADVMRRIALEEPLTPEEQQQASHCAANVGLYPLLNAAFAVAEREGLELKIDLRRPSPKRRRRAR